jgi:hypothetical protein
MESIRIILLSAFCANSTDQNITLSLQRAGSQVEDKQSKLAEDKDHSPKVQEEEQTTNTIKKEENTQSE